MELKPTVISISSFFLTLLEVSRQHYIDAVAVNKRGLYSTLERLFAH